MPRKKKDRWEEPGPDSEEEARRARERADFFRALELEGIPLIDLDDESRPPTPRDTIRERIERALEEEAREFGFCRRLGAPMEEPDNLEGIPLVGAEDETFDLDSPSEEIAEVEGIPLVDKESAESDPEPPRERLSRETIRARIDAALEAEGREALARFRRPIAPTEELGEVEGIPLVDETDATREPEPPRERLSRETIRARIDAALAAEGREALARFRRPVATPEELGEVEGIPLVDEVDKPAPRDRAGRETSLARTDATPESASREPLGRDRVDSTGGAAKVERYPKLDLEKESYAEKDLGEPLVAKETVEIVESGAREEISPLAPTASEDRGANETSRPRPKRRVDKKRVEERERARPIRGAAEVSPEARALFELGERKELGIDSPRDARGAYLCYLEASRAGFLPAILAVARCREWGIGTRIDERKAARRYRAAAKLGDPEALCRLGLSYANGRGVAVDLERAGRCFRSAARKGSVPGLIALGVAEALGRGVPRDLKSGIRRLKRAARSGSSAAKTVLRSLSGGSIEPTPDRPTSGSKPVRAEFLLSDAPPKRARKQPGRSPRN